MRLFLEFLKWAAIIGGSYLALSWLCFYIFGKTGLGLFMWVLGTGLFLGALEGIGSVSD